jgi:hypothetical protein
MCSASGPFAVPFRPPCGPFAVSRPTNSREHERTRSPDAHRFRGFSRVFAAVRGSLRQSGRTVRVGFLMRSSGCGLRTCNGQTGSMPGFAPAQAACMP